MSLPLTVHLPQYEGPLDLLLDLIHKQQVSISDIPIATITAQYLHYMEQAMQVDMELSADFVYMAATLIHIKSKMLLPKDPVLAETDPEDDPRQDLMQRLVQHERFKAIAEMLQQKRVIEEAVWSNPQMKLFVDPAESPDMAVSLFDLVKTLQQVVERVKTRPTYEIAADDATVPQMIGLLQAALSQSQHAVSARSLFERQPSRHAVICLFLAILELVKRQVIRLTQGAAFDDIALERHPEYREDTLDDLAAIDYR